jgi:hypothetical protein
VSGPTVRERAPFAAAKAAAVRARQSMKSFLLLLFFTGIVLIVVNDVVKRPPPRVEYRYLPRDLETYLRESTEFLVPLKMIEEKMYWAKDGG